MRCINPRIMAWVARAASYIHLMQAGNNRVIFWATYSRYPTNLNDDGLVTGTRNPEFHRPTSQRGGTGCCFSPAPGNHGTYIRYIHTEGPMYKSYFWLGCRLVGKKKRVCVYLRGDSKKGTCLTSMVNRLYKFRNCHGKTSTGSSTYIHTHHQGIDSTTKVLSQFLPRYLFLAAKGLRRSGNTRPHHIPNSERSLGNDKGKRPIDKPRGYICPGRTLHG
jgi:hypothetical protein